MLPWLDAARQCLTSSLRSAEQAEVAARLRRAGSGAATCVRLIGQLDESRQTIAPLLALRELVGDGVAPGAFERFALTITALGSLSRLEREPVAPRVKQLAAETFVRWTNPATVIDAPRHRFVAYAKLASLRRLPAGLFDWERSGLPRSWLPRIRPGRQLARILALVARRWRGFGPAFYGHLTVCRKVHAILPRDTYRAYYLMAASMALQPAVKGYMTAAWFHSPDTFSVTPHLAWMNHIFQENGALLATAGPDDPSAGGLRRSPERQRAFEDGSFKPTLGLVIWPREEMLAWAASHPELEQ